MLKVVDVDPLLAWIPIVGIEWPADFGPDAVDYRLSIIDWWGRGARAGAPTPLPLPPAQPPSSRHPSHTVHPHSLLSTLE